MSRPLFKVAVGFCLVAVLLVVAVVLMTLSQPVPPAAPLPNPNGYDDFVAAVKMIVGGDSDYTTMSTNELRAFVLTNAAALSLVRTGLTHECRVPLVYSQVNFPDAAGLIAVKHLASLLAAEGKLAESENRTGDAADSYLTIIRLGQESGRGGLIINSLVSVAVEAIGDARMQALLASLSAAQCRELASALESAEARREPAAATLAQEHQWARRAWGLKGQLVQLVTFKSIRQMEQRWLAKVAAQQNRAHALMIKLASRAYELEKVLPPPNDAALVPEYLKAVPPISNVATNASHAP